MKPDLIKKVVIKKLDKTFSWEMYVWLQNGTFADFKVESLKLLRSNCAAIKDMRKIKKILFK